MAQPSLEPATVFVNRRKQSPLRQGLIWSVSLVGVVAIVFVLSGQVQSGQPTIDTERTPLFPELVWPHLPSTSISHHRLKTTFLDDTTTSASTENSSVSLASSVSDLSPDFSFGASALGRAVSF